MHSSERGSERASHLVVLVHGIRTRAKWMGVVRATLGASGFAVEPTSYGRFDLFRFLLPVKYFRRQAMDSVWIDIQRAIQLHPGLPVSFIAHSFGTFIVANILRREFAFTANRVIFCGSIVHYRFPFEQISSRFQAPILNEVGTRDVWPIIAESVTWGYESSGAHGFNRAGVDDRRHNGLAHSDFLNADFCAKYWVPYLRDGTRVRATGDTVSGGVPWWLEFISFVRIKYLLILAIALFLILPPEAPTSCDNLAPRADTVRLDIIDRALTGKQYSYALSEAEQYLMDHPNDHVAYHMKGLAHYHLGQYDLAMKAYDAALKTCPKEPKILFNKAAALSELGDLANAIAIYEALLNLNNNDLEARLALAFIQLRMKEFVPAYSNYRRVDIHPNAKQLRPAARLGMGVSLLVQTPRIQDRVRDGVGHIADAVCLQKELEDVLLGRETEIGTLSYQAYGPILTELERQKIPEYERFLRNIRDRKVACK